MSSIHIEQNGVTRTFVCSGGRDAAVRLCGARAIPSRSLRRKRAAAASAACRSTVCRASRAGSTRRTATPSHCRRAPTVRSSPAPCRRQPVSRGARAVPPPSISARRPSSRGCTTFRIRRRARHLQRLERAGRPTGPDVISRIQYTLEQPDGLQELSQRSREQVWALIGRALVRCGRDAGHAARDHARRQHRHAASLRRIQRARHRRRAVSAGDAL